VLQHPVADGLLLESLVAAGRRHRHRRASRSSTAAVRRRCLGPRKAPVAAGRGRRTGRGPDGSAPGRRTAAERVRPGQWRRASPGSTDAP
jgi:hypothetical protein